MMSLLTLHLLMTVIWCVITESFSGGNMLLGALVGYLALWVARPLHGSGAYFSKPFEALKLLGFFLWELCLSSVRVAWDVVTPTLRARPGIVAVPLDLDDERAVTLLAMLVSLTPGTLAVDVVDQGRTLLVHGMYAEDEAAVVEAIKGGMERRIAVLYEKQEG